MRSFVGDEPFETVVTPPLERPAAEPAGAPAKPDLAPTLASIAWKLFAAGRSEQSTGDSGDLMPAFRQIWSILPQGARAVLRIAFRIALVGLAALLAFIATTTLRSDRATAIITGATSAIFLFVAVAFGRMRGWWTAIRLAAAGNAARTSARLLGDTPARIGKRLNGTAVNLYYLAAVVAGFAVLPALQRGYVAAVALALVALGLVVAARLIVTPNPLRSAVVVRRARFDNWIAQRKEAFAPWSGFAIGLGLGLLFVGVGAAMVLQGELLGGGVFALVGAMAAVGSILSRPGHEGAKPPPWTWPLFGGGGAVLIFVVTALSLEAGNVLAAAITGLFGVIFAAVLVGGAVQAQRTRRAAAVMHESAASLAPVALSASVPAAAASVDAARQPALHAAPIRIEVWLQRELPPLTRPYRAPVSAEANILGLPPVRILYLYNFFSSESLERKMDGDLRRFGPVYYLGSPGDFAVAGGRIDETVKASILPTPELFDQRLAQAAETPLAPGDKDLKSSSHFSGGFPAHLFLCNDESWRHAVSALFDRADVVFVDACGYDAQRGGLNWEFGQLIDRVGADRFVVLLDTDTDQVALCAAFRSAWGAMRAGSPNDRPDAAPVRWVIHEPLDENGMSTAPVVSPPPEVDPMGLFKKANFVLQPLYAAKYGRALQDDLIFGLFLEAEPP
jgi:hypothetical protein